MLIAPLQSWLQACLPTWHDGGDGTLYTQLLAQTSTFNLQLYSSTTVTGTLLGMVGLDPGPLQFPHVSQKLSDAKVHVRDLARMVRQVSLTAESINPLETPPYFLAVDQPRLGTDL